MASTELDISPSGSTQTANQDTQRVGTKYEGSRLTDLNTQKHYKAKKLCRIKEQARKSGGGNDQPREAVQGLSKRDTEARHGRPDIHDK